MSWELSEIGRAFAQFSGVLAGFAFLAILTLIGQLHDPSQEEFFNRSRKLQYALPILFTELIFSTVLWALVSGARGTARTTVMTATAGVVLALATVQLILCVLLYANASRPSWIDPPTDYEEAGSEGWQAYLGLLRTGVYMFRIGLFGAACLISYAYDAAFEVIEGHEIRVTLTLYRAVAMVAFPMLARFLEINFYRLQSWQGAPDTVPRFYDWCRRQKAVLPIVTTVSMSVLLAYFFRVSAYSPDHVSDITEMFVNWSWLVLLVPPVLIFVFMELYISVDVVRHLHSVSVVWPFRKRSTTAGNQEAGAGSGSAPVDPDPLDLRDAEEVPTAPDSVEQ